MDLSCGWNLSNASKLQFSLGGWIGEVTCSCDHGSGWVCGTVKLLGTQIGLFEFKNLTLVDRRST